MAHLTAGAGAAQWLERLRRVGLGGYALRVDDLLGQVPAATATGADSAQLAELLDVLDTAFRVLADLSIGDGMADADEHGYYLDSNGSI